jgi:hypothetical protein
MSFPKNACHSICFKPEFDSNEIDERNSPLEKYDEQRISTLRGIIIH